MDMVRNKVLVLVAAYNGQQWLKEQLDSLLKQRDVDVHVSISVDASTDGTLEICQKYADLYTNVDILPYGESFGSAGKNFYRLIKDCDFSIFDYIAFSDQDDIWHYDKLSNAIKKLQQYDCYSSNVTAFWDDGREILINKAQPQQRWDYLFEAAGPGCTYVFKRKVANAFKKWLIENYVMISKHIMLHDWLLYSFARTSNYSWYIDPVPSMLYRQHDRNKVGSNNGFSAAKKRLILIKSKWYRNQVICIATVLGVGGFSVVKKGLLNDYMGNLYLLVNINKLRRRFRDKIALAVALLFNIF
jgi:rhamnosyltransferase